MASGEPLAVGVDSTPLNAGIFAIFVFAMLIVVRQASKASRSTSDYCAAGRSFAGPRNGVALAGDFLSAVSILGISGSIAVYGYDGFLYTLGALVGWFAALFLAESICNVRRFTLGDVLSVLLRERPVRAAAATSTLVVVLFFLLTQMAGAGGLIALLLNVSTPIGQALVIAAAGALVIVYVLVGGMRGMIDRGHPDPSEEMWVARTAAVGIGVLGIVGGMAPNGQHALFLEAYSAILVGDASPRLRDGPARSTLAC